MAVELQCTLDIGSRHLCDMFPPQNLDVFAKSFWGYFEEEQLSKEMA